MLSLVRERRPWTPREDQMLREAVEIEDPNTNNPSKWHAISKHVAERTNKDCRKRWFAKMASDVVKGGWAPDEDERLIAAIERYGTRWSLVAGVVGTRNSDQCAKRWTDTLNPAIDRSSWTPEADALLLSAVNEYGKLWTKIVKTHFPGRTGLAAKNRYNSITRFNSERSRRPSKAGSTSSSSSSSSDSPVTPHLSIPTHLPTGKGQTLFNAHPQPHLWSDNLYSSSGDYDRTYTTAPSFPEDGLIAFPADSSSTSFTSASPYEPISPTSSYDNVSPTSPYDNMPSPFSSGSSDGYDYPQPILRHETTYELRTSSEEHWGAANHAYDRPHWDGRYAPEHTGGTYLY